MGLLLKSLYFPLVVLCYPACLLSMYQETEYSREVLCDAQDKIDRNCMQFMGKPRSELECAAKCTKNSLSTGYSISNTSCFVHFSCTGSSVCMQESHDFIHYHKETSTPCFHGGVWDPAMGRCSCHGGWIYPYCERRARNCRELYDWGYPFGILIVFLDIPDSSQEWRIVCFRDRNYVYTYVFGHTGTLNFNRTWEEYENGFFEEIPQRIPNFFIGLRPLYLLNEAGLDELVVGISFYNNPTNPVPSQVSGVMQIMTDIKIKDADDFYQLDFKDVRLEEYGGMSSLLTQSDCMTPVEKSKFSTWDMYNSDGENHAMASGIGWWYSSSGSPCNFLGKRCRAVPDMGEDCISVTGINSVLVANNFRLTRLFFRQPFV